MEREKYDWLRAVGIASGVGITLLCMILAGLYLGYLADDYLATAPWGMTAGGLLGAILGLWTLVRELLGK